MSPEAILAVILAKVFGVAGIGGILAGLFIKELKIAAVVGAGFGILSTIILTMVRVTPVGASSWIIAIGVGAAMAAGGWAIRGRNLT